MNISPKSKPRSAGLLAAAAMIVVPVLMGQETPAPTASTAPEASTNEEETVVLSPFIVDASRDVGYIAGSSLSGGRAETPLMMTPASISVMTPELLQDLNIRDARETLAWTVNVTPGNERQNETPFGNFEFNFRNTGGPSAYPSRNYFLFYGVADTYNSERFEFARGPNSLLFGDSGLGGLSTSFTKQALFQSRKSTVRAQGNSEGGWRTQLDTNYGMSNVAVRLNALYEHGKEWRDAADSTRKAIHLASSFKLAKNLQFRIEGEQQKNRNVLYQTTYSDQGSYWDKRTFWDGYIGSSVADISSPNNFGLEKFDSSRDYLVIMPYSTAVGVQNWRNQYRTRGTGFQIKPEGRTDIDNQPRLPTRKFNLGPVDAIGEQELRNVIGYLDWKVTDDWFVQLAGFWMDNLREIQNTESRGGEYRIDVNRYLPSGAANPKFGLPFADFDINGQYQFNWVKDFRLLTAYKFEIPKAWGLKQRFTANVGFRPEHFEMSQLRYRWANNPAQANLNNDANRIRVRLYWDEPSRYGVNGLLSQLGTIGSSYGGTAAGQPFQIREIPVSWTATEYKDLSYAQFVSMSTFWDDRVSLLAGVRQDTIEKRSQTPIGSNPDGSVRIGFNGQEGVWNKEKSDAVSKNLGTVIYPWRWLGLVANYSENFTMLASGSPSWNGEPFDVPRGEGVDFGVRIALPDNKLYLTATRYNTIQDGKVGGMSNQNEIKRIWTNIGETEDSKINFSARDTEDTRAKGWEFEAVANPTPSIRLTANYSLPDIFIEEKSPGLRQYFDTYDPEWTAWLDANPTHANRQNVINDRQTIINTLEGIAVGATNNGTYKWMANFYATYAFQSDGLKGLSVGGGANLKGNRKIGNVDARIYHNLPPGTNPTPTQTKEAAFAYLYAPEVWEASMHLSYTHKMAEKYRVRYQLNVSNLFNNQDLVITSYGTYNVGGLSTNSLLQEDNNFYYITPRRATFSVAFEF